MLPALIILGLIALPVAVLAYLYRRPLPQVNGTLKIAGLGAPVEIIRDRWGVPHIYAQNQQDLFFAQGYVHAQDRLWQMELNRRLAHGRLAEIFGKIAFDTDRLLRTIGLARAAHDDLARVDAETRQMLDAYARGVNAYVKAKRNRLPLEFTILGLEPAPWQPVDTFAWGKVMAWGLGTNWDNEIVNAALIAKLGAARAAKLHGEYDRGNPLAIQEHTFVEMLEQLIEQFDRASKYLPVGGVSGMSNNWVVDGTKSVTGKPLLANDPHLTMQMPSIWYENHLVSPELEVTGVSFPGAPCVILGHNRDVAWGLTAAFPDVQDLYIEKFNPADPTQYEYQGAWEKATIVREEIRVKGEPAPRVVEITITRHGPIVNALIPPPQAHSTGEGVPALALRWVGYEESYLFRAISNFNRARNWQEFTDALRDFDCPSHNFVYADREGNIGYYMPGKIPIRAQGSGLVPVPGWTGEHEWVGWIPHAELPHTFNPPQHYLATANNLVVGQEYPYFLTAETQSGFRARRIVELLNEKEKLSVDDCARMQVDFFCRPAQEFCALLTANAADVLNQSALAEVKPQAAAALDLLKGWDYNLTADSTAGAIYKVMQYFAMRRVFEPLLGALTDHYLGVGFAPLVSDHIVYFVDHAPLVLQRILVNNEIEWFQPATRAQVLAGALGDAIAYLRKVLGNDLAHWQWGKVHPIGFEHPLGAVKPLDKLFNRGPYPFGGDSNTVWQAGWTPKLPIQVAGSFTASWRQIIDLGDWDASRVINTTGQSGHPASKHYDDMIATWRKGEYHPMLWARAKVEANAEARLRLEP